MGPIKLFERGQKLLRTVCVDMFRLTLWANEALNELFALRSSLLLRGISLEASESNDLRQSMQPSRFHD